MKKTLRFIALTGIITVCWLSSGKPGHAVQYCWTLDGTPCSATNPRICITNSPGHEGTCHCISGYWYCEY